MGDSEARTWFASRRARVLGACTLAAVVIAIFAHRFHVARQWRVLSARAQALVGEWEAANGPRPGIERTASESVLESAFVSYDAARAALRRLGPNADDLVRDAWRAETTWSVREIEALLADAEPVLQAVRDGVAAPLPREPVAWQRGFSVRVANLLEVRAIAHLLMLEARRCGAHGETTGQRRALLDGLQLGRDFTYGSGTLIGSMIGAAVVDMIVEEIASNVLDDATAAELAAWQPELERLAADVPLVHPACWVAELALVHFSVLDGQLSGGLGAGATSTLAQFPLAALRNGLSTRSMLVEMCGDLDRGLARVRAVAAGPWREAHAALEAVEQELARGSGPAASIGTVYSSTAATWRRVAARARMLALAARLVDGVDGGVVEPGAVPPDPFGDGPLRWRFAPGADGGAAIELWSVGRDGVDDGGAKPRDVPLRVERPRR